MKHLFLIVFLSRFLAPVYGQEEMDAPKSWHLQDPATNKVQGISAELAYQTLLKGKKSTPVLVAVIDSGVDIDHEDLKDNIWTNLNEIPDNGIDDDNNGYIDDVHGWNFLGGKTGNVAYETYELSRIYKELKPKYEHISGNSAEIDPKEYKLWKEVSKDFVNDRDWYNERYDYYNVLQSNLEWYSVLLKAKLGTDTLTIERIDGMVASDTITDKAIRFMKLVNNYYNSIDGFDLYLKYYRDHVNYYDIDTDFRAVVGDNLEDLYEKGYGNNDVKGPDCEHGTHVSGIIGAVRDNGIGINGIAANVKIMPIRAVPDGDERDKDVANAIRYAVDNGAKIINMSFGKYYSPQKEAVDKATAYAESKGVLMIHGSGNENSNVDDSIHYPSRILANGTRIKTWMEVGATSWGEDKEFVADFSNYGQTNVDVFAPGVSIFSTTPNNTYEALDGTSMSAPVVAGIAALLLSYYPELTALQVKDIIRQSVRRFDNLKVIKPGTNNKVKFSTLSNTGGLVNAYDALLMAESMSIEVEN